MLEESFVFVDIHCYMWHSHCQSVFGYIFCRDALHKHSAPVWQVSWVTKERAVGENKAENLVSISVDGKILQWSIRKGFESTQLMKLKRMVKPKQQPKKIRTKVAPSRVNFKVSSNQPRAVNIGGEAYISQHAPGMGFDFLPEDSNMSVTRIFMFGYCYINCMVQF